MRDEEWRLKGTCIGDVTTWFDEYADARALCGKCPVFTECFDWISTYTKEVKGVVAGTTEASRKKMLVEIRRMPRPCDKCGKTFTPRYGHVRLCSDQCRHAVKLRRQKQHADKLKYAS